MLLMIPVLAGAQHLLKGKIIEHGNRQPVAFATVHIAGSTKITIADQYGHFELPLKTDTASITVSFVGYGQKTINIHPGAKHVVIELVKAPIDLKEVVISPVLSNASFHTISGLDLNLQPVNSSQDLLRLVPGLFIAQHMGGGKAEQIFLRGFDADHGTDVNISVDGMPVNMVSHVHGQGYADMHFLIPETVSTYDFGKGPYYSENGDFTTAGYLNYTTKDAPDQNMVKLEAGRFNTFRGMAMLNLLSDSARRKGTNAYIATEYNYTDGPFTLPEHYQRFNLFGKFTTMLGSNKLSVSASGFNSDWRAAGEIPERAVAEGLVSRFGVIDSLQGGHTSRLNANARLNSTLGNNFTLDNQLYYTHYTFALRVNNTFFAQDTINGDAVKQRETRDMFGYNGKLSKVNHLGNSTLTSTLGAGLRFDRVYAGERDHAAGLSVLEITQLGDITENNANAYIDESLQTGKWLFNAGTRVDRLYFSYDNHIGDQLPSRSNVIFSPKLNIEFTPNNQLQLYLKTGKGFHSNDVHAVVMNNGLETLPAAYGTDLGLNWKPLPRLYINAALWYLYLQQEFVYTDDGDIAPGGKTRRMGVDVSARYQFNKWLFANLNLNLARPRLVDSAAGKGYLPLAPTFTSTGGLDFKLPNGLNGGLSYRYMHKRPGNNDYSLVADGYFVTDMTINYTRKRYEIGLSVENLLNTKWTEFATEEYSRLRNEPAAVDEMSFTPGTPLFARLHVSLFF